MFAFIKILRIIYSGYAAHIIFFLYAVCCFKPAPVAWISSIQYYFAASVPCPTIGGCHGIKKQKGWGLMNANIAVDIVTALRNGLNVGDWSVAL